MSTALALAGVTAVLRNLLNDGVINNDVSGVLGSTVTVTARPPDRVLVTDGSESSQLNLFLHQVTPNTGWCNTGLPSRDGRGTARLSNPPLALDLHYLLSAYEADELHAEILLGYAMQLLHETPVLGRNDINTALALPVEGESDLPSALRSLAGSGLANQIEQIKITPEYLNTEEMSKLWTAVQSHYRPTVAYQASVVLIESNRPARSPLPVLSRGGRDPVTDRERGVAVQASLIPPVPMIEAVVPAGGQPVARLGETVDLVGHHLAGTGRQALLRNERLVVDEALAATNADEAVALMQFVIPTARADDFPVGLYQVSGRVRRPGETDPRTTNRLAVVVAPEITNLPLSVTRDGSGAASFNLTFHPELRVGQSVFLLLGQQAFAPQSFTPPVADLDFVVPDAPVGNHLARLRIDGIDSPIINHAATPPTFFDFRIDIS